MPTPRLEVAIRLDADGERALRASAMMKSRLRVFRQWVLYEFAASVESGVRKLVPQGKDTDRYVRSLRLTRIAAGAAVDVFSYGVNPRSVGREVDPALALVFVRPRGPRRDPAVAVLARYGPWTLDTIPFLPSKKAAATVLREVSELARGAVSRARLRDKPAWTRALARAGVRDAKAAFEVGARSGVAVPTALFVGARLEFGGEVPAEPHWRPAIFAARRAVRRWPLQNARTLRRLLTDPTFSPRQLVPRLPKERVVDARNRVAFQERLNLRRT